MNKTDLFIEKLKRLSVIEIDDIKDSIKAVEAFMLTSSKLEMKPASKIHALMLLIFEMAHSADFSGTELCELFKAGFEQFQDEKREMKPTLTQIAKYDRLME